MQIILFKTVPKALMRTVRLYKKKPLQISVYLFISYFIAFFLFAVKGKDDEGRTTRLCETKGRADRHR